MENKILKEAFTLNHIKKYLYFSIFGMLLAILVLVIESQ